MIMITKGTIQRSVNRWMRVINLEWPYPSFGTSHPAITATPMAPNGINTSVVMVLAALFSD